VDIEKFQDNGNTNELLDLYDNIAEQLIKVAVSDGHFTQKDDFSWPRGCEPSEEELLKRSQLISAIHRGIPDRRTKRLNKARILFDKTKLP